MTELDQKINTHFPGVVVRKDLVKAVKGNAIVPTYVLEYLLGQYCASSDEATIQSGIETVKEILARHYVHRNEAGLTRSMIRERGRYKVIDKVSVALNDKNDTYEAEFSNLGISKVLVDTATVKAHPKMLVSGVWSITDIEYEFTEDKSRVPWILSSIKPIQLSNFDLDFYTETREQFTTDEWINLLMQSIGFDPELFGWRSKLTQLVRLIPYVERNYNLIELGPKGTGKSHIYSEFSPHGILISGGEVTAAKLFVNNATGKIGLVGYWDSVAFDEFAGKKKRVDRALVDILKNYMANKSFSRGIETLGAEASMVFVGNTQHTVPYMLKHSDLFEDLPPAYHDTAFLDRLHFYIPGWEVEIIRGEMFSDGYGFVVDYLAEALKELRNFDYSNEYEGLFTLSESISTRDRDGILKTFSGLMKLIFPGGGATEEEIEKIFRFAIEGRKRVKDQILRVDTTFAAANFSYTTTAGKTIQVRTLEETEYPTYYHQRVASGDTAVLTESDFGPDASDLAEQNDAISITEKSVDQDPVRLEEGHHEFQENQKGVTFDELFGPYVAEASKVTLTDPYIRALYQRRNLMEFIETIHKQKSPANEIALHLVTTEDPYESRRQTSDFETMQQGAAKLGITFTWEFVEERSIHARHLVTDTGWKIILDRGLDIFQPFDGRDIFSFENRLQQNRACKAFYVTYVHEESLTETSPEQ